MEQLGVLELRNDGDQSITIFFYSNVYGVEKQSLEKSMILTNPSIGII